MPNYDDLFDDIYESSNKKTYQETINEEIKKKYKNAGDVEPPIYTITDDDIISANNATKITNGSMNSLLSNLSVNDCIPVDRIVKIEGTQPISAYRAPSTTEKIVGWMQVNTEMRATAKQNGFYYIKDIPGWVSAASLITVRDDYPVKMTPPITEAETEAIQNREQKQYEQNNKDLENQTTIEQEKIYKEYINSTYGDLTSAKSSELLIDNLNGVYGIPYQFPSFVDQKLPGQNNHDGVFGEIYAERIISRMPLLMMSPGKVDFLKNYSDKEKIPIIGALLSGGNDNDSSPLSQFLDKPGKYYTFVYDSPQYWKYVNTMNSTCATYLGIGDVKVNINGVTGKLRSFKWEEATNNKFDSLLVSSEQYVCFYTDASSTKNEDFTNSTSESTLASKVNSFSDLAKEVRFVLGATTGAKFGLMEEENIGNMNEKIEEIANTYLNGSKIFTDLGKDFAVVAAGGKLIFPEIWSDSDFTQSFDVNIKLRCPCPNPLQWFLDIIVPLNHLIAFTMPRTPYGNNTLGESFESVANGYMSPFLVRAFYRGLFNCDMGIVTSLSIQKGKEGSWTLGGLPSEVDVSLTIKDLYNVMVMTCDDTPTTFISNTCFLNYLANSCGVSINKPDIERSIDLYYTIYKNKITNTLTGYNFWNNVEQNVRNKALDIYQGFFQG